MGNCASEKKSRQEFSSLSSQEDSTKKVPRSRKNSDVSNMTGSLGVFPLGMALAVGAIG